MEYFLQQLPHKGCLGEREDFELLHVQTSIDYSLTESTNVLDIEFYVEK